MLNKLTKKSLIALISCTSVSISAFAITFGVKFKDWFNQKSDINLVNKNLNASSSLDDLQPFEQFNDSPILTQKTGPIISWGSTIKSLDWFGAVRWEIDLLKHSELFPNGITKNLVEYRNRAFISWDLDVKNNYLWLLMNTSKDTANPSGYYYRNILASKVVKINSLDGTILEVFEWKDKNNNAHRFADYWHLYYQISALGDGNVLLYSQVDGHNRKSTILNTRTKEFKENAINNREIEKIILKGTITRREVRTTFLIPVANDLNILVFLDFNNHGSRNPSTATGDLYLALVKDDFSLIDTQDNNWKGLMHIPNVFAPWTSIAADPLINRTIYRTFDNKIYFTIYNKFFVIDTKLNNQNGIDFAAYDLANSGNGNNNSTQIQRPTDPSQKVNAISSYTVDANENVYYKLINDSVIYNLKIGVNKTDVKRTTFASTTYYDLANNSDTDVKNNAKSFALFNVEGSTGSIFALNAKVISNGELFSTDLDKYKENKYGLGLAIVPNATNPNNGDSLGLLNTDKKFVKPADFEIEQTTLNQKLPSEITRTDLKLLNDGFFTVNKQLDKTGELKYLPFKIFDIDDENGTFKITANLDQIPWFTNRLPEDFVPRKVTHEFSGGQKISSKINWVSQANLSYDFLNTLPTKVTVEDLNSFDLFQANFASQTITSSNQVIYPKKTYSVTETNDSNGIIKIKVKYEYVPLGVNYSGAKDVKTYESQHQYTIFNSTITPVLKFAGEINNDAAINIQNTPVLKQFLQSSILPSSIKALIDSNQIKYTDFLNLAESKGYPTNKMRFELEPNDNAGTLVFKASLASDYYKNVANRNNVTTSFTKTFNGFNTSANYSFSFKQDDSNLLINGINKKLVLPSSITQANVISSFLDIKGFDPKDLSIFLVSNDQAGTIEIRIRLSSSYSSTIGNGNYGFSNYLATKMFSGFLTQQQFNEQFNIEFKDNENPALALLKQKTLLEINTALVKQTNVANSGNGLDLNGNKYTNLNDLAQKLLIEKMGNQIPINDWSNNDNIQTRMVFDNNAGTVAFFVTIKANANPTITSDLNFVVSYNDFARGNKVQTNDNLSFISNSNFNNLKLKDETPITLNNFRQYLSESEQNIKSLFSSLTGQYKQLMDMGRYEISVSTIPLFNSARVEITFEKLDDAKSLNSYSNTFVFNK